MKVIFQHNIERDIWCLLNKGKSSNNSQSPTKVYERLFAEHGDNLTHDNVAAFIEKYAVDEGVDFEERAATYQKEWETIADEYHRRAETIFGVSLPNDVRGYLTVNNRCPYSIEDNMFFVSVASLSPKETTMHELWHFYTWYGLGTDQEEKLGKTKYNDLKEALSVLLNVECKDLMSEGKHDKGYPQHTELREQILSFWENEKDIRKLWDYIGKNAVGTG